MEFDLAPPVGVGPLRIGMSRQEADAALDSLRDLSALSDSDRPGRHIVRPSGLMISSSCMQGQLEAIELWRPEPDNEPDEEQGHYFSSVLVAQPGCYDTPAETEERRRQTS